MKQISKKHASGFTIVELIVVIVVIGILASITIVSYIGVSQKAKEASLESDLTNSSKQIKLFQITEVNGNYPTANNCPTPGVTEICLKASSDNTYTYTPNNISNPKTFILKSTNSTLSYQITDNSSPTIIPASLAVTDPANWLTIGTQVWSRANLNVGTMVAGTVSQANNLDLEKYCYGDNVDNCATYGGLYQWGEAMQYDVNEGAQGICPIGSHIPTDVEWTTLTTYLGATTAGTQFKIGGLSGLNIPLSGIRLLTGSFNVLSTNAGLWSSSGTSTFAWRRYLDLNIASVLRGTTDKGYGYSVRCLGN